MTNPFHFLKSTNNRSVLCALTNEHPQIIAVVVACMESKQAAHIVSCLTPEIQLAVIKRIATIQCVEERVLCIIAEELKQKITSAEYIEFGGIDIVSRIFLLVDSSTRNNILNNLECDDSELAQELRQGMHTNTTIRNLVMEGRLIEIDK